LIFFQGVLNTVYMPNKRGAGLVMIGCWCENTFAAKIDAAAVGKGRSQFCREALTTKLKALGIPVDAWETNAPSRIGKGGPKRKIGRKEISSAARQIQQRAARRADAAAPHSAPAPAPAPAPKPDRAPPPVSAPPAAKDKSRTAHKKIH
jgi:hypothetical protein